MIGGSPGVGKTSVAKRLAADLALPLLGSDTLGRTVRSSASHHGTTTDAYVIGYAVLWRLCEEFLRSGVSVLVDTNMGWEVAWQSAEAVRERCPGILFLPIILRCPGEVCIERIGQRHGSDPARRPLAAFLRDEAYGQVTAFLERLDRRDAYYIDADRPLDEVIEAVKVRVLSSL